MDKYAIYTYRFKKEAVTEGDWTEGEQVKSPSIEHAQEKFEMLFGNKGTDVRIQKDSREGATYFPCSVLAHDNHVVLLRIENEKQIPVYVKSRQPQSTIAKIEKKNFTSSPYNLVIVDCRPNRAMIAIKVDIDSWRNTDTVRNLLQESFNRLLETNKLGFKIEILSKMQSREFWDYSRYRIKKEKRTVKKMTIYFSAGTINPSLEAIIKSTPYLKNLTKELWNGTRGEVTIYDPEGSSIIDKRKHTLENLVTLIGSNIDKSGFGLRMAYDDGIAFTCGKDVRAEFPLDNTYLQKFQIGTRLLNDEYEIEYWFDWVVEQTKEFKDAETVNTKPNRKTQRKVS